MLHLVDPTYLEMIGHAYDGMPFEACGMLGGRLDGEREATVQVFYPCRNSAESSKYYTVEAGDHYQAERDAESRGLEIIGVMHSHTHSEAYPSPTDSAQAPDPEWHYVIVSLADPEPVLRSYRIVEGAITEETVQRRRTVSSPE